MKLPGPPSAIPTIPSVVQDIRRSLRKAANKSAELPWDEITEGALPLKKVWLINSLPRIGGRSPLGYNLQTAPAPLFTVARAIRQMASNIERHPDAVSYEKGGARGG